MDKHSTSPSLNTKRHQRRAVWQRATSPTLRGNPLNELVTLARGDCGPGGVYRDGLIAKYGFAVPSEAALEALERWSPNGIIEIGAGVGYWARLLAERGVDVLAHDIDPPPAQHNAWFASSKTWYPVERSDDTIAASHPDRTLLVVWPTRGESWPTRALELFHMAGGRRVAYVGEGPGGRTGDDVFHARLGEISGCVPCRLGVIGPPCICGAPALWKRARSVELPHWQGFCDDLYLYKRRSASHRNALRRVLKRST